MQVSKWGDSLGGAAAQGPGRCARAAGRRRTERGRRGQERNASRSRQKEDQRRRRRSRGWPRATGRFRPITSSIGTRPTNGERVLRHQHPRLRRDAGRGRAIGRARWARAAASSACRCSTSSRPWRGASSEHDWREIDEPVADVLPRGSTAAARHARPRIIRRRALAQRSSAVVLRRADRRRRDRRRLRHPVQRRHAARPQHRRPRHRQSVSR